MDEFEPKLIYLVKRNPSLSREAFTQRWRQHGQLGMSRPRWRNIARYVHCDALRPAIAASALSAAYDGIGLIWHRSPAARAAHIADTSSRITMEQDELETFSEPVAKSCLIARETVIKACNGAHGSARKLFLFRHEIVHMADHLHRAGITPQGYTINDPLRAENASGWGLKFQAVEELWFEDESAAVAAAAAIARECRRQECVLVLTNEVILYASGP